MPSLLSLQSPHPREQALPYEEYEYTILNTTFLPKPSRVLDCQFGDVLNKRYSRRSFGTLSMDDFSCLLWEVMHTRFQVQDSDGYLWQHRSYPSAGGRHPIDLLTYRASISRTSLCRYDPISHCLNEIQIDPDAVKIFLHKVNEVIPLQKSTLLWFVAQEERTSSKYHNSAPLILLDAGVLLATVTFVSEALSLNCCPIGYSGEPELGNVFVGRNRPIGIGGCLIGSREL